MKLGASVTKDDLESVVSDLTPLRVAIDARGGRTLSLGKPHSVELVPGRGVRLSGDAKLVWQMAGLPVPVTIRLWQILLVPFVLDRDGVLVVALDPVVEALDTSGVPAFVDERIASAIREGLGRKLSWAFGKTLAPRITFPARMSPAGRFELVPASGVVEVTEDELRFAVTFKSRVVRLADESRRSA